MKTFLKSLKYKLQFWDFLWSIPLAFIAFLGYGVLGNLIFGEGFGFYDATFTHAYVYAALLIVGANAVTQLGLYFNARRIHTFFYKDAKKLFEDLEPKWKLCIGLGLFVFFYSLYFLSLLLVWKLLV